MTTDKTSAIVKHSEHVEKVQVQHAVLEDEVRTKNEYIPQCVLKTMQFFHKGKPRNNGSEIFPNLRILHS